MCVAKQRGGVRFEVRRQVEARPGWVVAGLEVRHSKRRKRAAVVAELTAPRRDDRSAEALAAELGLAPGVLSVQWEGTPQPMT